MAGAVGQQRVPKRYLETYKLNLPKFNEQREIVRILDGSFAKEQQTKEAAEAVLDQIDLMKNPFSPVPFAVNWVRMTRTRRARWNY